MNVYGIPNCNTVKKAITWLQEHNIPFTFHDYKKSGISRAKLEAWSKAAGWQVLLNKKGTTWRKIDPAVQETITTKAAALALMMEHTSVIKRPVIEAPNGLLVGFDEEAYQTAFLK